MVMQEASDALSKTADSDTVSTYQVSSVQLVTDKKLEAFNTLKFKLIIFHLKMITLKFNKLWSSVTFMT